MAHGYNFENWLDWPQCEDNWPGTFDKVGADMRKKEVIKIQKEELISLLIPKYNYN